MLQRSHLYRHQALDEALAASATLEGDAFNTGGSPCAYREFGAYFLSSAASAANGARLEISQDGVTWVPVKTATLAANVPQELATPILAKHHRAVLVNAAGGADVTVIDFARVN
jgi:hypothetical protein